MKIFPLTSVLGAEIFDADVTEESSFLSIFEAFVEYGVIAIRDQHITPEEQIRFAKRFGKISINRFFASHPQHPEIAMLVKEPHQRVAIGECWHTDHSYDEIPCRCSILHTIETPQTGGDTGFSSMSAAFTALSDSMKNFLRARYAQHSSRHVFGYSADDHESHKDGRIGNPELATQDVIHPVVIKHPLSGRECLFVNREFTTHIEGLHEDESKCILQFLYSHASDIAFTCRIRHLPGTITIWDNQGTWHKAVNDYDGHRRVMHRITVEGVALEPSRR